MHQKVVPGALADKVEVGHKGLLEPHLAIEAEVSCTSRLILIASRQAGTTNPLRILMGLEMEATTTIQCSVEKIVYLAGKMDVFPCTSRCTGNEKNQINWERYVRLKRAGFRQSNPILV